MAANILNKVNLAHVAHEYVVNQHMPKIKGTVQGLKLGVAVFYLTDRVNGMVEEHKDALIEYGIMDTAGNVDVDKLYEAASASLEMNDGKINVPKMAYVIDKEDLSALYAIAKNFC